MHKLGSILFFVAACSGTPMETTVSATPPQPTTASTSTPSVTASPSGTQPAFTSGSSDRAVQGPDYSVTVPTTWSDQMNNGVLILATPLTDEDDDFVETIDIQTRDETAEAVFESLGIDVDRIPVPIAVGTATQSVVIDGANTTVFTIVTAGPATYLITYRAGGDYLVWLSDVEKIIDSFAPN